MTALTLTPSAFMPRASVAAALKLLCRVVPKRREGLPILNNVLMRADAHGVVIAGNDLEMELRTRIADAIADDGFAVTVPAHLSYDVARSSDADDLTICDEGDTARFDLAGAASTFQALPVHDYPDIGFTGEVRAAFTMPADDLALALERCAHAISTEETRYYLCGVFLHVVPIDGRPVLRMVATDGHRMVRHDIGDAPEGSENMPGVIIPSSAVAVLQHMLKPTYEGRGKSKVRTSPEAVTLTVNCVRMRFEFGPHTLITKLVDGTFPDYGRVVPSSSRTVIRGLDAASFAATVKRIDKVTDAMAIKLDMDDGVVLASATDAEGSRASEMIEGGNMDGPPLEIGINASYLVTALGLFTGEVTIGFNDAGSPVTLTDYRQTFVVVMPMRV